MYLLQYKHMHNISINEKKDIITIVIFKWEGVFYFIFLGWGEGLLILHPSFCIYDLTDFS